MLRRSCTAFTSSTNRFTRISWPAVPSKLTNGHHSCQSTRLFASQSDSFKKTKQGGPKKRGGVPKKIQVNKNVSQRNADLLAKAFAEMARMDGFDDSTAYFADDATFEDDFEDDVFLDSEEDDEEDDDVDAPLNPDKLLDAFDDDDDDDYLDFGSEDPDEDMDSRIAAAKRDMDLGRVSVPKDLERFASSDDIDLRKLGSNAR